MFSSGIGQTSTSYNETSGTTAEANESAAVKPHSSKASMEELEIACVISKQVRQMKINAGRVDHSLSYLTLLKQLDLS